ncbi:nuclear transport factor 2 family protein [Planktotalea sp.]|uniref:nuclear transport factor 2 family protein n=1 Tax=Planktotalea sp. TaxID=2029877 RepID=UPI0032982156
MTLDFLAFAKSWEEGWNSHDLDRILLHYRDDICFRSRKAQALVGSGELNGKAALRDYWAKALERQPELKFDVQDVFEGHNMMVITYRNHHDVLAAETLYFDGDGMVYRASACHADIR